MGILSAVTIREELERFKLAPSFAMGRMDVSSTETTRRPRVCRGFTLSDSARCLELGAALGLGDDCVRLCQVIYEAFGIDVSRDAFDPGNECWEVGDGAMLDVLASDPEEIGVADHVSIYYAPGRVLSTGIGKPVFTVPEWRVSNRVGVYRYAGPRRLST